MSQIEAVNIYCDEAVTPQVVIHGIVLCCFGVASPVTASCPYLNNVCPSVASVFLNSLLLHQYPT